MYRINEGAFSLPGDWQDRTVNILASDNSPAGVSLTITRDDIAWGVSFAEYMEDQLARVDKALSGFELLERRELHLGAIPAQEIEYRWMRNQSPVHLLTTTLHLGRKALVISASVEGQMSLSQKSEMRRIMVSFQPDPALFQAASL